MIKTEWMFTLVFFFQGCTHSVKVNEPSEVRQESNRKSFATEIEFRPGTSELTRKAKDKLTALFEEAETHGRIETVKALSWGDRNYPSIYSRQSASEDEDLVVRRNQNLLMFLDPLMTGRNIHLFSMADRRAAINRYFAQDDDSTKRALENAGLPNTDTTVKVPGKASKSIVVFIMEE